MDEIRIRRRKRERQFVYSKFRNDDAESGR